MAKKKAKAAVEAEHDLESQAAVERYDELKALMLRFDNVGVAIDETQWRALQDDEQKLCERWLGGREKDAKSPVPNSLMPYASAALKAEYVPYAEAQTEARRVIMPCVFQKPSPQKPTEDGQKLSLPVKVGDAHVSNETIGYLCKRKHVRIEFSRRPLNEWDQPELPSVDSRRIIICVSDIQGYSWQDNAWKFAFLVDMKLLSIEEAFELWMSSGSLRIEVLGQATTKRGDSDADSFDDAPDLLADHEDAEEESHDEVEYNLAFTNKYKIDVFTQKVEGGWQCNFEADLPGGFANEDDDKAKLPPQVSESQAMIARIGRLIDDWTAFDKDSDTESIVDQLRTWLKELNAGKDPAEVATLMGAVA